MKKKLSIFAFGLLFIFSIFAQDTQNIEHMLKESTELFSEKKYEKSVKKINEILEYYAAQDLEISENVTLMAETVYSQWLDNLLLNQDINGYKLLREMLQRHPFQVSGKIYKRLDQMYELEKAEINSKMEKASEKYRSSQWLEYNDMLKNIKMKQDDLIAVLDGRKSLNEILQKDKILEELRIQDRKQKALKAFTYFIIGGFIALIGVIIRNIIKRRKTEEKFEVIMNVVSFMNKQEKATSKQKGKREKTEPLLDLKPSVLLELEKECNDLGSKIDSLTGRKNNSRKVSELVYKMAKKLNISDESALIFFCAGMVYDCGFLAVDKSVFETDHLSIKQREWIRDHVNNAEKYFNFIPKEILPVFLDAAEYHHENFDGSGYINGMHEKEIPLVARLIHTAESYVSLVNKRSYRDIMDKEKAIAELKRRPGVYDPKTIEVLEEII